MRLLRALGLRFGRADATPQSTAHTPDFQGAAKGWAPTHQHKKGGLYRKLATGTLEADRSDVVIYDDPEGRIWVRAAAEFQDGRFRRLNPSEVMPKPEKR